ncbi:lamin tail domain-containing protein [Streptomyces sp. NPDC003247]|uniref:lamin tail domain-containing protein n=1 Tax=Streptomyces sp. NPDC003247 TaxID=3364677 RepID=UPI0036BEA8D3
MSPVSPVSTRRLAVASLAAAAVIGAVAVPASAAGQPRADRPKVEISDVQYDAPGHDTRANRSLNKEWVELTNTTRREVNLDGWTLSDEDGDTYTFDRYRLAARATVRVHTGEGRDTRTDLYQDRVRHVWDNDSDTVTLRNERDRVVDEVSWDRDRQDGDRRDGDRYDGDRRHGDRHDGRHHGGGREHGDRHDGGRHHGGDRF